jgi:exopolysaccharide biosynthesis protein
MLVRESRIVPSSHDGPSPERHPRTGIGLTRDGSTLFVTVDGRRTTAVGMTIREFAIFMRALGAVWAVNLDGGASTTMVAGGKLANSPSDRLGERLVGYAVVLLTFGRPGMSHLVGQLKELEDRVDPVAGVQGIRGGSP